MGNPNYGEFIFDEIKRIESGRKEANINRVFDSKKCCTINFIKVINNSFGYICNRIRKIEDLNMNVSPTISFIGSNSLGIDNYSKKENREDIYNLCFKLVNGDDIKIKITLSTDSRGYDWYHPMITMEYIDSYKENDCELNNKVLHSTEFDDGNEVNTKISFESSLDIVCSTDDTKYIIYEKCYDRYGVHYDNMFQYWCNDANLPKISLEYYNVPNVSLKLNSSMLSELIFSDIKDIKQFATNSLDGKIQSINSKLPKKKVYIPKRTLYLGKE